MMEEGWSPVGVCYGAGGSVLISSAAHLEELMDERICCCVEKGDS